MIFFRLLCSCHAFSAPNEISRKNTKRKRKNRIYFNYTIVQLIKASGGFYPINYFGPFQNSTIKMFEFGMPMVPANSLTAEVSITGKNGISAQFTDFNGAILEQNITQCMTITPGKDRDYYAVSGVFPGLFVSEFLCRIFSGFF